MDFGSIETVDEFTENTLYGETAGNTTKPFESRFARLKTFNTTIGGIDGDPFSDESNADTSSAYLHDGSTDSSSDSSDDGSVDSSSEKG